MLTSYDKKASIFYQTLVFLQENTLLKKQGVS